MTTGAPTFSVVIPAYNARRTIETTIGSVLAQTRPDLELIVVDDGSADDTPERVEALRAKDDRIELIRQANQGTAGARNTGLERAAGEFVSLLDNDDLWLPDYLENMGRALDAAADAGFAYTDAWLLDDRYGRIRRLTSLQHYDPVPPDIPALPMLLRLIRTNFIMSSVTIRRAVLAEVGAFNPELRGTDDWDLWLRILAGGHRAVRVDGCVLIQRDHPSSQSKDEAMMLHSERAVVGRLVEGERLPPEVRDAGRRKLDDIADRLSVVERRGGAFGFARDVLNRLRYLKGRLLPWIDWRREPPPDVARAFPEIAEGYGRPARSDA